MQGDVEHRGVVVECLLGAVAMVNVPVHDEDLAHAQLLLQEFSCDGYGVEEAESPEGCGEEKRAGASA